ncbi:MAG: PHP domain-containing protein [Anaerolineae bacterium]|nr:PHP domain-containing protein [Anaerolineae bacterium]
MNALQQARTRAVRADLHVHTCASDSRWTAAQVVDGCRAKGIGLLAVADHDTTDSVPIAESLALESGIGYLRAVEVSSTTDGVLIHILAYGIDVEDPTLRGVLDANQTQATTNAVHNLRRLVDLDYPVSLADFLAYEYHRSRGGFKLLNYLSDCGIVTDLRDFFLAIAPHFDKPWASYVHPERAVAAIRAAGGIPVMAHPGASLKHRSGVTAANLSWMCSLGIAGFECYSQYHDAETISDCVTFCDQHDLAITGGSDFHGHLIDRALGSPEVYTGQFRLYEIQDHILYPDTKA